jgi:hypothetical protein
MPHPFPLSAIQLAIDLEAATQANKRLVYSLWDDEVHVECIVDTCIYGFPSCVLVRFSIGSGVSSECWNSYGMGSNNKQYLTKEMHVWMATKITEMATGTELAVGNYGNIVVEDRPQF